MVKDYDLDCRLSFEFYNHYSTLNFAGRMKQLSQQYDYGSFLQNNNEYINWKDEFEMFPKFLPFYFNDYQEAHYDPKKRHLLRFI